MTQIEVDRKTLEQQQFVKETLTRALDELKEVKRTGRKLQSAGDFMKELEM